MEYKGDGHEWDRKMGREEGLMGTGEEGREGGREERGMEGNK